MSLGKKLRARISTTRGQTIVPAGAVSATEPACQKPLAAQARKRLDPNRWTKVVRGQSGGQRTTQLNAGQNDTTPANRKSRVVAQLHPAEGTSLAPHRQGGIVPKLLQEPQQVDLNEQCPTGQQPRCGENRPRAISRLKPSSTRDTNSLFESVRLSTWRAR